MFAANPMLRVITDIARSTVVIDKLNLSWKGADMNHAVPLRINRIEILTIGDELLDGVVADKNTAWFGQILSDLGYTLERSTTVRDDKKEIIEALHSVTKRADLCICTGGLGPTEDDVTVEALAGALGSPLAHDEDVWDDIQTRYAPRIPPENNRRQARIPEGAWSMRSHVGTAPGIGAHLNGCQIFVFPGVPQEFKWFINQFVVTRLLQDEGPRAVTATLRFSGIGESNLALSLANVELPDDVSIGYRTAHPENHVRVRARAQASLNQAIKRVIAAAPTHFVGQDDRGLSAFILDHLRALGHTLSIAEHCTGGLLSAELTTLENASDVFLGSIVTDSESVTQNILEVEREVLDRTGVGSELYALDLAESVRRLLGSDWAIGVSGLTAHHDGQSLGPDGTVCFAWVGPDYVKTNTRVFTGNRERIKRMAVGYALDGIRKYYGD